MQKLGLMPNNFMKISDFFIKYNFFLGFGKHKNDIIFFINCILKFSLEEM